MIALPPGRGRRVAPVHVSAVAAVALALAPAPAPAQGVAAGRALAQADGLVDEGDFEGALAVLGEALGSPDNSNAQLVALRWRMGEVLVFMRREEPARQMFERLLYLDPDFEPPGLASARVRAVFDEARRRLPATGRPAVELRTPSQAPADRPPVVRAGLSGMRPGFQAVVCFRGSLSDAWQTAELREEAGGAWAARLPAYPPGSAVEYYVEIRGPDRRRLQGAGSALEPLSLRIAPAALPPGALAPVPPATAWYKKAWIWGVVGGVAVTTAVVLAVTLSPRPATLDLTVRYP